MSGGSVPYHLRQNKSVERAIFVEALNRIGRATPAPIQHYGYVGFAGPFSEDFKLIHSQVGIREFVSVENDEHVHQRQLWNCPLKGIDYRRISSGAFIDAFDSAGPTIVWLDYASPREIESQLNEVQSLVSKMSDYDILKVTFNASAATLGHDPSDDQNTGPLRAERARQRLGAFLGAGFDITPDDVDRKGYPQLVLKAAELALKQGMAGNSKSRFQPITTFTYADSAHTMLTLTGVLLPEGKVTTFMQTSGITKWDLATRKWGSPRTVPIDIAVPEMSLRERLFVDQQLPTRRRAQTLMKQLGFRLGGRVDEDTISALSSYSTFYRYFPYFSKMVI